jgi:hypothetical protein
MRSGSSDQRAMGIKTANVVSMLRKESIYCHDTDQTRQTANLEALAVGPLVLAHLPVQVHKRGPSY